MTRATDENLLGQVRLLREFGAEFSELLKARATSDNANVSEAELRVLAAINNHPQTTAKQVSQRLAMDTGYLSRVLARLSDAGLITRSRLASDARHQPLSLTPDGQTAVKSYEADLNAQLQHALEQIAPVRRRKLATSLSLATKALQSRGDASPPVLFRPPRPGDLGWIIYRHGTAITEEFGWDATFEWMVTGIVADFIQHYNAQSDRCIIAEQDGDVVGSVFLVRRDDTTAKLRLLYVEPAMRGLGLGKKLVEKAVREAERIGYEKVTLWTHRGLDSARKIYEATGFQLVEEAPHSAFGSDRLEGIGQIWELALSEHAG